MRDDAASAFPTGPRADVRQRLLRDVQEGLARRPRAIPCKWLHDAEGARLFERVVEQPEFRPVRAELQILETHGDAIAARAGVHERVVELGGGAGAEIELLLAALSEVRAYLPVDVGIERLRAKVARVGARFPSIVVRAVCRDLLDDELVADVAASRGRTLVFSPGGAIGDLDPASARALLGRLAAISARRGSLLVGFDRVRDPPELVRAYDDAAGATAALTRNLLARLNRELGAGFDLEGFRHVARWSTRERRVEVQLVATRPQVAHVGGRTYALAAGEPIVAAHAYKWDDRRIERLASATRWTREATWVDATGTFQLELWRAHRDEPRR